MGRELFGEVTNPSVKLGNQQWHTLPLSILAHIIVIALLIVVPLMAGDVLPTPRSLTASFVTPPSPPLPPPPPPAARPQVADPSVEPNSWAAPVVAPPEITPESGFVEPEREAPGLSMIGVVGSPGAGIVDAPPVVAPPPAPIRIGGGVVAPKKLKDVSPVYSAIAQSARVQGVVTLEATIGVDGRVQEVRVLRSIPLLDGSAIDAVKQWQYTPTLLNGIPVPVIMTVTVNFTLR